ncbi:four helix bundle protein [Rhizobium sp. Leaf371]|uniref:four helix bundle protein n=1 Tax=Rhizobium sp. Leaf371 TaxID=1736355 RepID=UPI0007152EA2|nr:four helix bundle protein [Rhizobium sp. Leaf371]KQS63414.1 four helix bundle protein [Rhizobium sp. Leaf371]
MESQEIKSYRDLRVWQTAIDLSVEIYALTNDFPKSELYGMTGQMRRSSVSVAANIAEGYGRNSHGSFVQFLKVAQGSLKELETHLIICERVGLMDAPAFETILKRCEENGKMISGLIRAIQRRGNEQ